MIACSAKLLDDYATPHKAHYKLENCYYHHFIRMIYGVHPSDELHCKNVHYGVAYEDGYKSLVERNTPFL